MKSRTLSSLSVAVFLAACGTPQTKSSSDPSNSAAAADGQTAADAAGHLINKTTRLTLAQVKSAIATKGAKWTANNSPLSLSSSAGINHRLGVKAGTPLPKAAALIDDRATAAVSLPTDFDWRNQNGQNFVSPVLDQGQCGSCVAFATVATFETQLNIAAQDTHSPYELSPEYLFTFGGGDCAEGWDPFAASQFLVSTGIPENACMPYTSGAGGVDGQAQQACSNPMDVKAASFSMPTVGNASITAVKTALLNGPLITTLTVYEDFEYYTGGVYEHVTGQPLGGHAMSIVGWSDDDQAWICRNSWGANWGMNGFIEVAYADTSGVGQYTWSLTVPPPAPYVAFETLRGPTVLSGQNDTLNFDLNQLNGSQVGWQLSIAGLGMIGEGNAAASNSGYSSSFDSLGVGDGVYTLQPTATTGALQTAGEMRQLYVLNGTETATFDIPTTDAGTPLSGTVNLELLISAAPVPLTNLQVTFNYPPNTNPSFTFGIDNPGSDLVLFQFDSTMVPDGAYTMSFTGAAGTQTLAPQVIAFSISNAPAGGSSGGGSSSSSSGGGTLR